MNKKMEAWCYGGKSKAFFISQSEAIHQYNTKMMDRLLVVMTIIVSAYLVLSTCAGVLARYLAVYPVWFALMLGMLISFKLKKKKAFSSPRYILYYFVVRYLHSCAY